MNQASCYLGDVCNNYTTQPLRFAVCTGAGYAAECNTAHRALTDSTRLQSYSAVTPNTCDTGGAANPSPDFPGPAWYRFTGSAGSRMATVAPAEGNCATDAPGYLTGGIPTTAAGLVTRAVCYSWVGNTCWRTNNIQMVNCGGYHLYNLPDTPGCSIRYCGAP
jgi:hypothetical protein